MHEPMNSDENKPPHSEPYSESNERVTTSLDPLDPVQRANLHFGFPIIHLSKGKTVKGRGPYVVLYGDDYYRRGNDLRSL